MRQPEHIIYDLPGDQWQVHVTNDFDLPTAENAVTLQRLNQTSRENLLLRDDAAEKTDPFPLRSPARLVLHGPAPPVVEQFRSLQNAQKLAGVLWHATAVYVAGADRQASTVNTTAAVLAGGAPAGYAISTPLRESHAQRLRLTPADCLLRKLVVIPNWQSRGYRSPEDASRNERHVGIALAHALLKHGEFDQKNRLQLRASIPVCSIDKRGIVVDNDLRNAWLRGVRLIQKYAVKVEHSTGSVPVTYVSEAGAAIGDHVAAFEQASEWLKNVTIAS